MALAEPDLLTRFTKIYSFYSDEMKDQLYQRELKEQLSSCERAPKEALARLQRDVSGLDPLTQMLYIDTRDQPSRRLVDGWRQDVDGPFSGGQSAFPATFAWSNSLKDCRRS